MDGTDIGPKDETLAGALRRAAGEARPRPEFRVRLRAAFAAGGLQAALGPDPAAPPADTARPRSRLGALPRWIAYPAAAAILGAVVVLSGALEPAAIPDPILPMAERPSPAEEALVAAERRIAGIPGLGGRKYQHRIVEGRPILLPAEAAFADADELRVLSLAMTGGESLLTQIVPALAARRAGPLVTVVAPTRGVFESLAGSVFAPIPVGSSTVACALSGSGVLLLSPGVLDPGGPACEEMDVVHESVHGWFRARVRGERPLPLWVDEGFAGLVSQAGAFDTKEWCRMVLSSVAVNGLDPVFPAEVLDLATITDLAAVVKERAPCEDRPYTMLSAFHAHAESMVMFLLEDHPGCAHRAGFQGWLEDVLDGTADTEAFATAQRFGFESPEALFRARDEWLGLAAR